LALTDLLFWVLWISSGLIALSLIVEGLAGIGMLVALRSVRTASVQVTKELSKISKALRQVATMTVPQIKTLSNEMSGVVHHTIHQSRELASAWHGYSATAERMMQKTQAGLTWRRRRRL
jgi:hypothetical protein